MKWDPERIKWISRSSREPQPRAVTAPEKPANPSTRAKKEPEFKVHPPEEIIFDTEEIPTKDIPIGATQKVTGEEVRLFSPPPSDDGISVGPKLGVFFDCKFRL